MLGELTEEQIEYVLQTQITGRIACCADDDLYVVPVTFVYHKGHIYAHSKEGRKVQMMRKNPKVCIMVDKINSVVDWSSVVVWGRFKELSGVEAAQAMGELIDHLSPGMENETRKRGRSPRDVTPAEPGGLPQVDIVYAVEIEKATGRSESPDA